MRGHQGQTVRGVDVMECRPIHDVGQIPIIEQIDIAYFRPLLVDAAEIAGLIEMPAHAITAIQCAAEEVAAAQPAARAGEGSAHDASRSRS